MNLAVVAIAAMTMLVHDQWADGSIVPPWVKVMCCGAADVHRDSIIERDAQGQVFIKGLSRPVDPEKIFDSQDGHVWSFYRPDLGQYATVYCLFIPPSI